MANVVGTLTVDLVARTASFEGPLDSANTKAKTTARSIQDSFNSMDFKESTGGLSLIDELLGIHIPRHAASFAAQIPGVMQVAAEAMPVAAFVAIGVAIVDATNKAKEHEEAMKKDRLAMLDEALAMGQHAEATRIANLQLQDQIAVLGHKLPHNAIVIAMEEGRTAVDNLIKSLGTAIDKETELIGKQQKGFLTRLLTGDPGNADIIDKAKEYESVIDGLISNLRVARQEGSKQQIADAQKALDTELSDYRNFLNQKRSLDEKAKQDEIATMRSSTTDDVIGGRQLTDDQRARAQEVINQRIDLSEKDINQRYLDRRSILNDLTILLNNYNEAQIQQAKHTSLAVQKGQLDIYAQAQKVSIDMEGLFSKAMVKGEAAERKKVEDAAKTDNEIVASFARAQAFILAGNEKLAAADQARQDRATKIADALRLLSDEQAVQNQRMAIATGLLTQQQAVDQSLKEVEKNKAAALADVNAQLDIQFSKLNALGALTMNGIGGTPDQKAQFNQAVDAYQHLELTKLEITKRFNAQLHQLQLEAANNEHSQWQKMALDFSQIWTHMSQSARQTLTQMNSSIAAFVVTGQGNFRQLEISAAENFVQMALQYAESKVLMRVIDSSWLTDALAALGIHLATHSATMVVEAASSTAAGAAAALASVPFPANLGAAATVETIGDAFTMAAGVAARGALLPSREMLIHTHPEEMILPQHISNFIVNAASNASGYGHSGDTNHNIFAPNISAPSMDAAGFDRVISKHMDRLQQKFFAEIRRRNY